jgi:hypothetical protein
MGKVQTAKALVEHAKGKWIGGADKEIAKAQAALKAAVTEEQRVAATKEIAKWQANRADGVKALAERQADYDAAKVEEARYKEASQIADANLTAARAAELSAAKTVLAEVEPLLTSRKLDPALLRSSILTEATPKRLAEYAQQSPAQAALVDKLLSDETLMREMLIAGGATGGRYGQAMEIFTKLLRVVQKPGDETLRRLALAVSLEHAQPVPQSNPEKSSSGPRFVDPVGRYQHYEKAYLAGELDPAFKSFTTWEYRMIVDCDAPDEILAWGREMLRTYRPDHIYNPDYGWRYSGAVRTDVAYGSQNVQNDDPALHNYQNIPRNGGVCGRRAFFGRFILRSFGIPVWGVTQHKHAALSHWTPKGWVINLGAGFNASWWDKDDMPLSGTEFLRESQAREYGDEFVKALRARWISRVLGETAYSERKSIEGGFWSTVAFYFTSALASKAVELGPLGQELAEANEAKEKNKIDVGSVSESDKKPIFERDGSIRLPSVGHGKATGRSTAMKSFGSGQQIHCEGGFQTEYTFEAPNAGRYMFSAQVATLQDGQTLRLMPNGTSEAIEIPVPYTVGLWKQTSPVQVTLTKGKNILGFALKEGSRGVTIKEFDFKPVR